MMTTLPATSADDYTTRDVARLLGMSVRSVQLMVDRGELEAWKTPGGHRRISGASVEHWRRARGPGAAPAPAPAHAPADRPAAGPAVLLIDDSVHFQKLVALLMKRHFPDAVLSIADDGIAGLAMYGKLQPQVLIVDILLPGIDGATLITSLRLDPQFARSKLVVITSLDAAQRAPYAFALEQVPVVHKPQLVAELPAVLAAWLQPGKPAASSRGQRGAR